MDKRKLLKIFSSLGVAVVTAVTFVRYDDNTRVQYDDGAFVTYTT